MVWHSHPFKNFPQFVVIHTVKVFSIVSEAEVDVFWNSFEVFWPSNSLVLCAPKDMEKPGICVIALWK